MLFISKGLQKEGNLIVIFTLALAIASAKGSGFAEVFGTEPEITNSKLVYFWVFATAFGFLIDLILVVVLFTKHKRNYIKNHVFLATVLVILTLGNSIHLLISENKFHENEAVLAADGLLIACFMLQILLGVLIRAQMRQKFEFSDFYVKRRVHRWNGLVIYCIGKIKLLYLAFYVSANWTTQSFVLAVVVYVSLLACLYAVLFARKRSAKTKVLKRAPAEVQMKNEELLEDIIRSIDNYEFGHDETLKSVSSIYSTRHQSEPLHFKPSSKEKWFAFEDNVYRIPKIDHAGGNYFLKAALHSDMTFYMHGIKAFVVFDNRSQNFMLVKHKHSGQTDHFLVANHIGKFAKTSVFVDKNSQVPEQEANEKTCLNLFNKSQLSINVKDPNSLSRPSTLEFKIRPLSKMPAFGFVFGLVQKKDTDQANCYVDLKQYWVKMLGKYFMMEFGSGKKMFATPVLSLNPNFLRLKANFLAKVSEDLSEHFKLLMTPQMNSLIKITDNLEDPSYSNYMPIFLRMKPDYVGQDFNFSAPIGLGLGFTPYSTEKYLVLAKNDGIVPFIDFLEVLYQKCVLDLFKMEFKDWVFGSEYRLTFTNGLSFTFLWIIDDDFMEWAKSLGLGHLQNLMYVQSKLSDKSRCVIKEVWVDSADLDVRIYPSLKRTITHDMHIRKLLSVRNFDFDRILVSGDDKFKQQLFVGSHLTAEFLDRVQFI
jgi:hypothetical protein